MIRQLLTLSSHVFCTVQHKNCVLVCLEISCIKRLFLFFYFWNNFISTWKFKYLFRVRFCTVSRSQSVYFLYLFLANHVYILWSQGVHFGRLSFFFCYILLHFNCMQFRVSRLIIWFCVTFIFFETMVQTQNCLKKKVFYVRQS